MHKLNSLFLLVVGLLTLAHSGAAAIEDSSGTTSMPPTQLQALHAANIGELTNNIDTKSVEESFQSWLTQYLLPRAKAQGVSDETFASAFRGVTVDWDSPGLRPPGVSPNFMPDQHQAEFNDGAGYFNQQGLNDLVAAGRKQQIKHTALLHELEQRYGVPGPIILAIWARESVYGTVKSNREAIRTLATQAYMGLRRETFRDELIAALILLETQVVSPAMLKSSWAGALGQPQLMPSRFSKYAVDFDQDGNKDIWNSTSDSLAIIANYLKSEGWNSEETWGFEVYVPPGVPCTEEGPDNGKPLTHWISSGIRAIHQRAFSSKELQSIRFLLMPAGRGGPAFVVSQNFYVLKQYNFSDL